MDNIDEKLWRLAKSGYWQSLFGLFKGGVNLSIFDNLKSYSGLQVRFLYWLSVIDMMHDELVKHEDEWLSDGVLNSFMRTNAYLVYRNKKHDFLWQKYRREERKREHIDRHPGKHKDGNVNMIDVQMIRPN